MRIEATSLGVLAALLPIAIAAAQGVEIIPICQVQGTGKSSPYVGEVLSAEGIVTANFVDTATSGFFLQEPDCDDDVATSDGIFVYASNKRPQVREGDRVRVTGTVQEYYGLTEFQLSELQQLGEGDTPNPASLEVPDTIDEADRYLESREGMIVSLPPQRVVGATNDHGEAYLVPIAAGVTRLFRASNSSQLIGVMTPGDQLKLAHGDLVSEIEGPLNYTYDNYKVALTGEGVARLGVMQSGIAPPVAAPSSSQELMIATYNLQDLFDPVDDAGKNDADWTPDPEGYEIMLARRARSIAENLGAPDVVGVQEVENLGVLTDLASHELLRHAGYKAVMADGPDLRGIDVGLLYRSERLRVLSFEPQQACTPLDPPEPGIECELADGSTGHLLYSRPPLAVRLAQRGAARPQLIVVVNHFKSKRGGDESTEVVRMAMAAHNLTLLAAEKQRHGNAALVIMGDLNDFEDSGPLAKLTQDGKLVDLHGEVPPESDYTYIFSGISENLDYILVEPTLLWTSFTPIHSNTDFPAAEQGTDDADTPRCSDHDPLLLRIPFPQLGMLTETLYLPFAARTIEIGGGGDDPTPEATAAPTSTATPSPQRPPADPIRIDSVFYNGVINPEEPDEFVEFTNVSEDEVSLIGWQIISVRGDQRYDFPTGFTMPPLQTCRVYTDQIHEEHCGLSWGSSGQALWRNTGDKAEVRDASGALIDWYCYGDHEDLCP